MGDKKAAGVGQDRLDTLAENISLLVEEITKLRDLIIKLAKSKSAIEKYIKEKIQEHIGNPKEKIYYGVCGSHTCLHLSLEPPREIKVKIAERSAGTKYGSSMSSLLDECPIDQKSVGIPPTMREEVEAACITYFFIKDMEGILTKVSRELNDVKELNKEQHSILESLRQILTISTLADN